LAVRRNDQNFSRRAHLGSSGLTCASCIGEKKKTLQFLSH
jgi:hypothetical protein